MLQILGNKQINYDNSCFIKSWPNLSKGVLLLALKSHLLSRQISKEFAELNTKFM